MRGRNCGERRPRARAQGSAVMTEERFSICTTNYNCAHVLEEHLDSVFRVLKGYDFEYLVVDNRSKDNSVEILRRWASTHPNMRVWVQRCTMGRGRQIAFERSGGEYILVLDMDVIYAPVLADFLRRYLADISDLAVQGLYCGIFPRAVWEAVGGRRSLNTHEDLDMWVRISRVGKMRWYPFALGRNVKETDATGGSDFLSTRYTRADRLRRVLRRHYDLWKTRELSSLDLVSVYKQNQVDFGLGPQLDRWFENWPRLSLSRRAALMVRELRQAWRGTTD